MNSTVTKVQAVGPYQRPEAGHIYEFTVDVWARSGHVLEEGSLVRVIEPTRETPHGEIGPDGVNWLCEAENGYTVWATLEQCISRGLLRRIH